MSWSVEFLDDRVWTETALLPVDLRARLVRVSQLISTYGIERIHAPHVKHLQGPLWEIRLAGRDGIARALYVTAVSQRVVIVRVFVKKTQKTPLAEIRLALERAKEIQ